MSDIAYVTDDTFDAEVAEGVVLVDFTASWCGPCKALAPVLDDIAADPATNFRIVKVDIDDSPATKERFQIRGVPTLVLMEDGDPLTRIVGGRPKAELLEAISALV
ncbi:MAG TPA: thioredoxin [Jatrophihabitantaceae bacterium]|jgi:thioredoxin 1|nr:thioredoxin [Jatrophihabitantaceae bacterium]